MSLIAKQPRWTIGATVALSAALVIAGCSSSGSKSAGTSPPAPTTASTAAGSSAAGGSGALPTQIKVVSVRDQTGLAAFAGIPTNKGTQLAFDEINAQHFLGPSTTMVLSAKDSQGSATTAASAVSTAIADSSVAAIFGPESSSQAVAAAPIAQRAKMPIVFTQSGSAGVLVGEYTFRATAPMSTYYPPLANSYLKSKNIKTLSIVYDSTFPTLAQLAQTTYPAMAKTDGFSIKSSTGVPSTTTDFSAPITKVVGEKPDAVALLLNGAANGTAMQALRQAGYTGPVMGNTGAGAGNLSSAGKDGAGMTWPTDFSYTNTASPSAQAFVKAYKAKYNENPLDYAAEGYDAAWWLARAIKAVGSVKRADIQRGLAQVAKAGFQGAEGKITFAGNDMRVPGVLVQWDGTKETLVHTS